MKITKAQITKWFINGSAILVLSALVFAFEGRFSWIPPTEYTDGTPLLEQDIDFYTLYCDGAVEIVLDSIIGTWDWQAEAGRFAPGDHSCYLTVTTMNGLESAPSNTVNFTVGPRVPKNATGLVFQ